MVMMITTIELLVVATMGHTLTSCRFILSKCIKLLLVLRVVVVKKEKEGLVGGGCNSHNGWIMRLHVGFALFLQTPVQTLCSFLTFNLKVDHGECTQM